MDKFVKINEIEEFEAEAPLRITNEELILITEKFTNGKNIYNLPMKEISDLVQFLYKETNASYRQIASVTHEHYDVVRRICKIYLLVVMLAISC
jgi:hypothetical protein